MIAKPSAKAVFLVNPASAGGRTGHRWPELAHRATAIGLTGDALFSESRGHLRDLARETASSGASLVVAVGGDGTVNEVATGLVEAATPTELAVIPRGTGVDFVRTFGIPTKLDGAVRVAIEGHVREIDVGRVGYRSWDGSPGQAYFANIASVGMSGAIAKRVNEARPGFALKASYFLTTLAVFARWRNTEVSVSVDGESRRARMHDVVVANCRYFGAGMKICPEAEPDDGVFDVLLIGDITKADLVKTLPKIYRGTHLPHPKAELLRGKVVSIDAGEPLPFELDGEQPGTTPVRFEVVPKALRLRVPPASSSAA